MAVGARPRGDRVLVGDDNAAAVRNEPTPTPSRLLPHPDGFRLAIRRSLIAHPAAGYGVFVEDAVRAGTPLALYPGRLYAPPELTSDVTRDNEYMNSFKSGWVVDGREWHRRGERFEQRLSGVLGAGIAPPTSNSMRELLRYRNPIAIGNYVNHPPPNG